MVKKQQGFLLDKYVTTLYPADSKNFFPIKDQSQIPFILDTLSRKNRHHLMLFGSLSETFNFAYLQNLAHHLHAESIPKTLADAYFLHWDVTKVLASADNADQIEIDFKAFSTELGTHFRRVILAINQIEPLITTETQTVLGRLAKLLKPLLADEQWRIIVVTQDNKTYHQHRELHGLFSTAKLNEATMSDALAILKNKREDFENFHQVVIPDETFSYALSMANHYLSGSQANLDKALWLLDSGAARASALETNEQVEHNPILTNTILANIVSSWTRIPLSHLQHNKVKPADFIQGMQKTIFGQDAAINIIGLALQYARIKLQPRSGPLCSFLFAGPANVGKTETAFAIAEQLFGHKNALLRVNLDKTICPTTLSDIKVMAQNDENNCPSLFDAISQCPYAVVLLQNINLAPPGVMDLFHEILTQGYALDEFGNKYDFRHAIVIVTTTLGSERIISLTQPAANADFSQTVDLMQLVLNEPPQDSSTLLQPNLSSQELCEEMMPMFATHFSVKLLRQFNIVPFALLDYASIEKIMRIKLKALARQLDTNFGIELTYSAEILRFLVQETLSRSAATRPIDKTLEQHLYSCVVHELLVHADDKNRSKRLQLQLNDAGQLLRCEFLQANDSTLYHL